MNLNQFMKRVDSIRTNHAQILVIRSLKSSSSFLSLQFNLSLYVYSIFVNFKYLVNFVGICNVIDYIVVWLKLTEKKKKNKNIVISLTCRYWDSKIFQNWWLLCDVVWFCDKSWLNWITSNERHKCFERYFQEIL